jgi:glycosyltransferase involved in cell wall biosynthesis
MADNVRLTEHGKGEVGPRTSQTPPRIAILIPCFNKELTIADMISTFRRELPDARVYVFDNNSTDRTVERAREKGATILRERRQGKGFVVQSMFRETYADVYVMVNGDGTYPRRACMRCLNLSWRTRQTWSSVLDWTRPAGVSFGC